MDNSAHILLIFSIFSFLASFSSIFAGSPPPTCVASYQLKLWREHVNGAIPKSLLSKFSPLSKKDTAHFGSLASTNSLKADSKFCSLANLACASKLGASNVLNRVKNGYNEYGEATVSPSLEHFDPNSFFRLSVLKKGNIVHLPNLHDQFPPRSFLPTEIASKMSTNPKNIQMTFPESFNSPATKDAILSTFQYCDAPMLKGEIKSCPKSLEEMIGFAKNVLGGPKQLQALASKSTKGSGSQVLVGNVKRFQADKIVSCHEVFLPFATYFCHLLSSTRLYAVDLVEAKTGAPMNTLLASCHMDTSQWPANHPVFHILNSKPGLTEACHWLTQIDLVWIANAQGKVQH